MRGSRQVKEVGGRLLGELSTDRSSEVPLHTQIYAQVREMILVGHLAGGVRLPSTRTLATDLGVSRITVVNAYEDLTAEGFLRSRAGDGTYVGDEWRSTTIAKPAPGRPVLSTRSIAATSSRGSDLYRSAQVSWNPDDPETFLPSQVGLDAFPWHVWKRLLSRHSGLLSGDLPGYGDPFGYGPLREAIADYLGDSRGLSVDARQIVVCSGAQQALSALALLLVDSGDETWIENPGHIAARRALLANGCTVRGVPIDDEGANLETAVASHGAARLAFLTPSRQHPLGNSMPLSRRMDWINWANTHNSWIIEDDADGELRYRGTRPPTMFGLDRSQHVIHVGSFSKIMFPAVRVGYAVLPDDLAEPFSAAITVLGRTPSAILQAVTADFLREGHMQSHIRRTRQLYQARQETLLECLDEKLFPFLSAGPMDVGMHVLGWLREGVNDQQLAAGLADRGVYTYALGDYYLGKPDRDPALLIGFASTKVENIPAAVDHLVRALHHIGHRW